MKKWKQLDSKVVFDHPRIRVIEDTVELPSGEVADYVLVEMGKGAASCICQREDGKFLVQKEYSYPPDEWLYQFPGGGIEEGESEEKGVQRELAEEAGYQAGSLMKLGKYLTNNRKSRQWMHVYLGRELVSFELENDLEEEFETFWLREDEIDTLIKQGAVVNVNMLAAWQLYKAADVKVHEF